MESSNQQSNLNKFLVKTWLKIGQTVVTNQDGFPGVYLGNIPGTSRNFILFEHSKKCTESYQTLFTGTHFKSKEFAEYQGC